MVSDMTEDQNIPLGQPFLVTSRTEIDVQEGLVMLQVGKQKVAFNIFKPM